MEKSDDSTKTDNKTVEIHVIVLADEEKVITPVITTDNIILIYPVVRLVSPTEETEDRYFP